MKSPFPALRNFLPSIGSRQEKNRTSDNQTRIKASVALLVPPAICRYEEFSETRDSTSGKTLAARKDIGNKENT
jgi:hypothetical protein